MTAAEPLSFFLNGTGWNFIYTYHFKEKRQVFSFPKVRSKGKSDPHKNSATENPHVFRLTWLILHNFYIAPLKSSRFYTI